MAGPYEIAFSSVWHRESIEALGATGTGAFVNLARAAIYKKFNPFESSLAALYVHGRLTSQQWRVCGPQVLYALRDTLPRLQKAYADRLERKDKNAKNVLKAQQARMKNIIERKVANQVAHNFTPQGHGASLLQPLKAQSYKPENTDQIARKAVLKAIKDKPGTTRLTDKI